MTERRYTLLDVSKRYGDQTVLASAAATFSLKGLTAIVGPSGSGKSTLFRLLALLEGCDQGLVQLKAEPGTLQFDGRLVPWPFVTCVFQRLFLWPHMTLRQNILLPMTSAQVPDCGDRLGQLIVDFQMADFIDRYPNEVSGGQAQRAAIARALGVAPSILLLDEIHTGLDFENQAIVNARLLELVEDGVSVVVVTHSLNFVERFASRVVLVKDRQVTAYPEHLDLSAIPYIAAARGLE